MGSDILSVRQLRKLGVSNRVKITKMQAKGPGSSFSNLANAEPVKKLVHACFFAGLQCLQQVLRGLLSHSLQ